MQIFEELKARGLIAQLTDEEEIRELVNAGKATFYIGFDATADSLHIGHFMALNLMRRLQLAGNRPIALLGGGTTMVGDPLRPHRYAPDADPGADSGQRRQVQGADEQVHRLLRRQGLMVNNADWLLTSTISSCCARSARASPSITCSAPSAISSAWSAA